MLYNAPAKGEDGLYFVKALSDEKRKCLIQLNGVKVVDVSGDVVLDLVSEANTQKIQGVDAQNLAAASENCKDWFGRRFPRMWSRVPIPPVWRMVRLQATASKPPRFSTLSRRLSTLRHFSQERHAMSS